MKMLLVDDEVAMRSTIANILKSQGVEVLQASGGIEALDIFKENPEIALVVSDIRMPDGDGVELLKNIKKISPKTPVVIMTGYSEYDEDDIADMGAEAILSKPFSPTDFFALVKKYES